MHKMHHKPEAKHHRQSHHHEEFHKRHHETYSGNEKNHNKDHGKHHGTHYSDENMKPDKTCHYKHENMGTEALDAKLPGQMYVPKKVHNESDFAGEER